MTPSEIAETLLSGNISFAREVMLSDGDDNCQGTAVLVLDVLMELADDDWRDGGMTAVFDTIHRLRRCLTGGT